MSSSAEVSKQDPQLSNITDFITKQKGVDGVSINEHLYLLLHKLLREPNQLSSDSTHLELISDFVKKNSFHYKNPLSEEEVNNIPLKKAEHADWLSKSKRLFHESKGVAKDKEKLLYPNFYEDYQMLEMAGIGFSEEESLRISQSVRKLADKYSATTIRFWGKLLTRGKDYYVAQGLYSNQHSDILPEDSEQKGEGVNKYTFWVTHDVLEQWHELPLVTSQQVAQARQIKYICTGDLNSAVKSYPPFSGKEKHFVKAQLARITFGSELAPKGLYRAPEEGEPDIQFEEEPFKLPEFAELLAAENWVHVHPALQKQGRVTVYVDSKLSEEDRDAKRAEIQESDPDTQVERLRDIAQDKSPYALPEGEAAGDEEETNWPKRQYGDLQQFNSLDEGSQLNYNCVCFKNLTWPGANLVANSSSYCNIYVGYGLKSSQHPFLPVEPSDMLNEQEDTDEFPEPNPSKPPDEVESDSDEEKKEDEEDE